jgi:hypothetical protein
MHGRDDKRSWVPKSIAGINLHTEIESCEEQDGRWIVDTVMRGDFKASPARFLYTIGLRGNKISALRVGFLASLKEISWFNTLRCKQMGTGRRERLNWRTQHEKVHGSVHGFQRRLREYDEDLDARAAKEGHGYLGEMKVSRRRGSAVG